MYFLEICSRKFIAYIKFFDLHCDSKISKTIKQLNNFDISFDINFNNIIMFFQHTFLWHILSSIL
jgi:hypothetical protein